MNILLWNVEFATANSERGRYIISIFEEIKPDIICLTEGYESLLPTTGYIITSEADYGYINKGNRRKVLLWSNSPWSDIDREGSKFLPSGRYISGISHGIRVVGICIPWQAAHVISGYKNKQTWEDHFTYINEMKPVLNEYLCEGPPICVLGDFNQRIPKLRQPVIVFQSLIELFSPFEIITKDIKDDNKNQLIDHVALGKGLHGKINNIIPKVYKGLRLSDHVGISIHLNID